MSPQSDQELGGGATHRVLNSSKKGYSALTPWGHRQAAGDLVPVVERPDAHHDCIKYRSRRIRRRLLAWTFSEPSRTRWTIFRRIWSGVGAVASPVVESFPRVACDQDSGSQSTGMLSMSRPSTMRPFSVSSSMPAWLLTRIVSEISASTSFSCKTLNRYGCRF
jgi:hypothetical protein